jgi:hypothetical protein
MIPNANNRKANDLVRIGLLIHVRERFPISLDEKGSPVVRKPGSDGRMPDTSRSNFLMNSPSGRESFDNGCTCGAGHGKLVSLDAVFLEGLPVTAGDGTTKGADRGNASGWHGTGLADGEW